MALRGIKLGFCPTGPGGGIDNSCGREGGGGGGKSTAEHASKTANQATGSAKGHKDHAIAAQLHTRAAQLHEQAGNKARAAAHYAAAVDHNDHANSLLSKSEAAKTATNAALAATPQQRPEAHAEAAKAHAEAAKAHAEAGQPVHAAAHEQSAHEHSRLANLFHEVRSLSKVAGISGGHGGKKGGGGRGGGGRGGGGGTGSRKKKKPPITLGFCPTGPGGGIDNSCAKAGQHSAEIVKAVKLTLKAKNTPNAKHSRDLAGASAKSQAHTAASDAHKAVYDAMLKAGQPNDANSLAGYHLAQSNKEGAAAVAALRSLNEASTKGTHMVSASSYADKRTDEVKKAEAEGKTSNRELSLMHSKASREHKDAGMKALKYGTYSPYHNEMKSYHRREYNKYRKMG